MRTIAMPAEPTWRKPHDNETIAKGTRVKYADNAVSSKIRGQVGTVLEDSIRQNVVRVVYDNNVGGHTLGGICETGHGWNASRENILVEDVK